MIKLCRRPLKSSLCNDKLAVYTLSFTQTPTETLRIIHIFILYAREPVSPSHSLCKELSHAHLFFNEYLYNAKINSLIRVALFVI